MPEDIDLKKYQDIAKLKKRYEKQLDRLHGKKIATGAIEHAVEGAISNIKNNDGRSLVIYGEPQSGKTEMMIGLTAKLLDEGYSIIIHLMNDSVDLLNQNLKRFKSSGLAPIPRTYTELPSDAHELPPEIVVFCKKNAHDLPKLIASIKKPGVGPVVIIDDEADYATPNGKINQGGVTKINELVGQLLGEDGFYIGVTATPARLDLNNTFNNDSEQWVQFKSHDHYTGQDIFFPIEMGKIQFRLNLIKSTNTEEETKSAIARFLVTAAYLNTYEFRPEENWTMLVHTSGKKIEHKIDQRIVESFISSLLAPNTEKFHELVQTIHNTATKLYPEEDPEIITRYVVENASRITCAILNSERDRKALGDNATEPTSPFSIIIGGNIVSRGVTFPNLLSMYFTRDVKTKLQQDTYIQRARMFGAREKYLSHFELTIQSTLYADWRRCFIFHKLALKTIANKMGAPVWLGDKRISVASSASVDRTTVQLDKGEMGFQLFEYSTALDELVREAPTSPETLAKLQAVIGIEALPQFLIDYIKASLRSSPGTLAIHESSSIDGYTDAEGLSKELIVRKKGFIGKPQLERAKYITATHHIKIFHNSSNKARLFYKFTEGIQFIQNKAI
ncbi:Z1 domain-containing protein [Chromobacterium violaceum]|uniref:Z1 domain-containing protein n=1 Tax=Chromobacterium violaceum TaxID=536 RepID=UPI003DA7F9D1